MGTSFSLPVQNGSKAHPASYTMGTGSFPGVKRPGRGVDHPPPTEVKERVELYLFSPCGPSWPVLGRNVPSPLFDLQAAVRIIYVPKTTWSAGHDVSTDQVAYNGYKLVNMPLVGS